MKKTVVINILGGPGVGKTTISSRVFAELKKRNFDVENVSEFAKELVWEGRSEAFNDRLYMHGEQNHRLMQMNGKLDYIVTDSPLILTSVYNHYYLKDKFPDSYNEMIDLMTIETFKLYDNEVFLIERNCDYQSVGRRENEKEANDIDNLIHQYLKDNNITYHVINDIETAAEKIVGKILG